MDCILKQDGIGNQIMLITKVSYRRTFNLGNYENETIEYTAEVDINESADDVLEKIRVMVHNQSIDAKMLGTKSVKY